MENYAEDKEVFVDESYKNISNDPDKSLHLKQIVIKHHCKLIFDGPAFCSPFFAMRMK